MNDNYGAFDYDEICMRYLDELYFAERLEESPSDKACMIFCKDKYFVRIGLKAIQYDVKGLLDGIYDIRRVPDMAMLVDLFCEPDVPRLEFEKEVPVLLRMLGSKKYGWHYTMLTFVEKICKAIREKRIICDREIHAELLTQARSNTQLLQPWIEHVLLTSKAVLRFEMVVFCEQRKLLPMLLPLTTIWRPRDNEPIDDSTVYSLPCCFWDSMHMSRHNAHKWFWPRLYLYHTRLLRLMSSDIDCRRWFEPAFADYVMRCCLGLKGTGLSALPIARIIFFCLHNLYNVDKDELFTRILGRVSKIFSVCNNNNETHAGRFCKQIKIKR